MQQQIQELLTRLTSDGTELGAQFAAYQNGKLIVDAWAGVADRANGRPVDGDTLFPVFSVTKAMAATLIHILAERGMLTYDMPISKVWPEFGAAGKTGITLRQALNHSAGVPQMPRGIGWKEVCDWDYMCAAIAAQAPLWPPGSRIEYHPITFGWIVGEVARRVDGRAFGKMLAEEIRRPLGIEAMYVGIPDAVEERVVIVEHNEQPQADDGKPQTIPTWMGPLYAVMNRADFRRACVPASNGIMSARAIARHYAALLPGGIDGVELLPPARMALATERQRPDKVIGEDYQKNRGLGYMVGGAKETWPDHPARFGHGGFGGAMGFADRRLGLAVGFTRNLFKEQGTLTAILRILGAEK